MHRLCWLPISATFSSNRVPQNGSKHGGPVIGRYCLAHAGYGGSNNNMGIEVDWQDVKKLVPPSATMGTFTVALMQFMADLSQQHIIFLEPTNGLFPSKQEAARS